MEVKYCSTGPAAAAPWRERGSANDQTALRPQFGAGAGAWVGGKEEDEANLLIQESKAKIRFRARMIA